ncbi:hypothetical protein DIPPA_06736 [Diplonema papillatum]|nr:hypothetical protein DIPPA_06736 [Diplonema papillatum]
MEKPRVCYLKVYAVVPSRGCWRRRVPPPPADGAWAPALLPPASPAADTRAAPADAGLCGQKYD